MKILLVLFRTLGDICMGTTVLRAVKSKYPDAQIDFMTEKQNINILEGNPDVNNIIIGSNYFEALDLFSSSKYDKIYKLNMANHTDTCWHHILKHQNQHLTEWYAQRAEIKNLDDKNIYIYPSENDIKVVDEFRKDLPKDLIAIHTSSGWHGSMNIDSKDWPIQYFEVIAERLIRKGYNVIQIGGEKDKKLTTENVIDGIGKLTFKQTSQFLKHCKLFLGVDSGPAYLAGWSGIPSVVIMGSTQNYNNITNLISKGPFVGPRNDNVHYINPTRPNNPNCQPIPCYVRCLIGKSGGCIIDVTTDMVWTKLINILGI